MVGLFKARDILAGEGWLAAQPEPFRSAVLGRAKLIRFAPGTVIYEAGDPPGGIYGLVEGAVAVTTSPAWEVPRLGHVSWPGSWIGVGGFISRGPRRIGMRAMVETWMMHLSLQAMDQIEGQEPGAARRFAQILMIDFDNVMQAFLSLQKMGADQRIASTLQRIAPEGASIRLSQTEVGTISNTSRKHVNAALHRFEKAGWLKRGYRSIIIKNIQALRTFADGDQAD